MLNVYQRLSLKEKTLVWIVAAALVILLVELGNASEGVAAAAQVVAGLGTLVLASLAFEQVREMRETRLAQERPQVLVAADHSRPPFVNVVVRNIGKGAARNISFEFSAPVDAPESEDNPYWVPINEQDFFVRGLDFLAPGAEVTFFWGSMITLAQFLRDSGLQNGITTTARYESLTGEPHETVWNMNPLLMANRLSTPEVGMQELVETLQEMSMGLSEMVDPVHGELRVTTASERQDRQDRNGEEGVE